MRQLWNIFKTILPNLPTIVGSCSVPHFHLPNLRRKPRSAQALFKEKHRIIKQKSFDVLKEYFGKFIPCHFLTPEKKGALSRQRIYSKSNVFWAFLAQVLDADGGCREVVRKLQVHHISKSRSLNSLSLTSASTAAYCKARQKLNLKDLEMIFNHTAAPTVNKHLKLPHYWRLKLTQFISNKANMISALYSEISCWLCVYSGLFYLSVFTLCETERVVSSFNNGAMMCDPIQKCGCHFCIAKDRDPLPEFQISRNNHAGFLIKFTDEVKEQCTA
jgi:hypothetical protein